MNPEMYQDLAPARRITLGRGGGGGENSNSLMIGGGNTATTVNNQGGSWSSSQQFKYICMSRTSGRLVFKNCSVVALSMLLC